MSGQQAVTTGPYKQPDIQMKHLLLYLYAHVPGSIQCTIRLYSFIFIKDSSLALIFHQSVVLYKKNPTNNKKQ